VLLSGIAQRDIYISLAAGAREHHRYLASRARITVSLDEGAPKVTSHLRHRDENICSQLQAVATIAENSTGFLSLEQCCLDQRRLLR